MISWMRQRDHSLLLKAIVAGVARWEPFAGEQRRGEVCVEGLRHCTELDESGCPKLSPHLKECITAALQRAGEKEVAV